MEAATETFFIFNGCNRNHQQDYTKLRHNLWYYGRELMRSPETDLREIKRSIFMYIEATITHIEIS